MASPAITNFRDYINARKALVDTSVANRKTAVDNDITTRKAQVDAASGNAAQLKVQFKAMLDDIAVDTKALILDDIGADVKDVIIEGFFDRFDTAYQNIIQEYLVHCRRHLQAALADGDILQANYDAVDNTFVRLLEEDAVATIAFAKSGDFNPL